MALFLPLKYLPAQASGSAATCILSSYNLSGTFSGGFRAPLEALSTYDTFTLDVTRFTL